MLRMPILAAALAALAAPALAQVPPPTRELPYDRGYDKPTPRGDAINAREGPIVADLNRQAGAASAIDVGTAAEADAQYAADRAAYLDALAAHDAAVDRTDARFVRQQLAYADAMRAWRAQVRACRRVDIAACRAPTPNPADFY